MAEDFTHLRQIEHHIDASIRLYANNEPDDYPPHWHNSFEIIMPVENTYTVAVADVDHVLHPGEILVIPAGAVHEIFAPDEGMRYFFLIDQEEVYAVSGLARARQLYFPCVHLMEGEPVLWEARQHLERAVKEYEAEDEFSSGVVRMEIGLMLIAVARFLERGQRYAPENQRPNHEQSFLAVCNYIASHCAEPLTLERVAAYTGYSKCHFSRMFKSYTGMSFYDYFLRQRLIKCKQLLGDPSLSVTEAALRAGFGSIATFNRVFRQQEGMTPSQFRALNQPEPHRNAAGNS